MSLLVEEIKTNGEAYSKALSILTLNIKEQFSLSDSGIEDAQHMASRILAAHIIARSK